MTTHEMVERSPVRTLSQHLGGGIAVGQVGAIVARPGVGKSALLVHIALDALMRDVPVLHVALRDTVDHVRSYYDEIFGAMSRTGHLRDRSAAMVGAERHRMIHSYRDRPFDVGHLRSNLEMLADVAQFHPKLLVIDAMDSGDVAEYIEQLADVAAERGFRVWITLRSNSGAEECALQLKLHPAGRSVEIGVIRAGSEERRLPVRLDPETMLVIGADEQVVTGRGSAPKAIDCTLYSGGANGTEATFGEAAAHWGVSEVNFTFDGHRQSRTTGRHVLSPRELAAGDVSLVYVSRRLNRTYSEGGLIRRVLQTIWHMVSRSQQVFVVGVIQEDGTVRGGTGWSVELARMWNKDLWVFDQERHGWFRWDGKEWVGGTPTIVSVHYCGTGTRYLSDEGRTAITDLFQRSFGD